jgi:hypothetical protein
LALKQFRGRQVVDKVAASRHSGRSSTRGGGELTGAPDRLFSCFYRKNTGSRASADPDAGRADREICVVPEPYALLYLKLSISDESGASDLDT